ncbi:MAG: DUF368 domain-containing protein [Defluviitaleaceae bacterium]|nr:DUF368 domain-containing protein [Defluviitaleaceae bacterium]
MLALKGIAIGAANVVPGVSGATLAVIFRVYDRLIESIDSLFKDMKNSLKFLIPLGIGMVVGIITLGSLLDFFLQRFSFQAAALIAGLMAGSIPFIYRTALSKDKKKSYSYAVAAVFALAIILLAIFAPTPDVYVNVEFSIRLVALLFIGGVLTAAALMFPGISGAMVLILLGVFPVAMHTISLIREYLMTPFDFGLLTPILIVCVPIGLGLLVGALAASRLISFLLKKHHGITYFAILGLIFGTIFVLFHNDATYASHEAITPLLVVFAVIAFAAGAVVSLALGKK